MAACDHCSSGPINFCHMCDTSEGNALHWEYVTLWHLEDLFPCDYQYPSYEWIEKRQDWVNMMNQITHQNVKIKVS